jgi:hypothetical protein
MIMVHEGTKKNELPRKTTTTPIDKKPGGMADGFCFGLGTLIFWGATVYLLLFPLFGPYSVYIFLEAYFYGQVLWAGLHSDFTFCVFGYHGVSFFRKS